MDDWGRLRDGREEKGKGVFGSGSGRGSGRGSGSGNGNGDGDAKRLAAPLSAPLVHLLENTATAIYLRLPPSLFEAPPKAAKNSSIGSGN